jgi:hypothetical protein
MAEMGIRSRRRHLTRINAWHRNLIQTSTLTVRFNAMARKKRVRTGATPREWADLTVAEINGEPWVVAAAVMHTPVLGPFPDAAAAWRWIDRNDESTGGGSK